MSYTDLIKIERPLGITLEILSSLNQKALAGSVVEIYVYIKNQHSATIGVKPRAIINGAVEAVFTVPYVDIPAGYTYYFTGRFTMPSADAEVRAESYFYGVDGEWHFEDYQTRTIPLEAIAPTYDATITAKSIRYDSITVPIPASNITQGASTDVRVKVRNDSSVDARPCIALNVVDPDGFSLYTYAICRFQKLAPGAIHDEFVSGIFTLSKAGTYRIRIDITLEETGTTLYDYYDGVLCTTVPQEIPTGLRSTSIDTVYGTYDPLDSVPYVLRYEYKGKTQSGTLQIELGTGAYPYFTPEAVIGPVSYSFAKKDDWGWVTENRSFILPDTVRRGQTYSARVTLKTADGITDNDIDYTALKVSDPAVATTDLRDLDFTIPYGEYDLGHSLPIHLSYRYQGVAQSGQVSVQIGKGIIFSPVYTYSPKPVSFAHADALTTQTTDIEVTLPMVLEPGQVYSIKVVMETSDGETADRTKGSQFKILETAVPEDPGVGDYRVVKDYYYPAAETYVGDASQVVYEFTVPMAQLDVIGDWISKKVIDEHENEVKKHGSQMLHLKVSEREHGLTSKDYLVVATATAPKETAGQEYTPLGIVSLVRVTPLGIPVLAWVAIVGAVLIILGFLVQATIKQTAILRWGPDVIEKPTDWGSMGALLALGLMIPMLGMMQEQTRETYEKPGAPKRPKPYTEAALKAARGAAKLAETGVDRLSKEIGRIREEKRVADEEERRLLEQREREKQEKLREAQEDLRRRRAERDEIERWF